MTGKKSEPERQETYLTVSYDEAKEKLSRQIDRGNDLLTAQIGTREHLRKAESNYNTWRDYTTKLLDRLFTTNELADEFSFIGGWFIAGGPRSLADDVGNLQMEIRRDLERLTSIRERIELFPVRVRQDESPEALWIVETIARRFYLAARQLTRRYNDRTKLDIRDEYDVQDLLHALLRLHFDDVRPEEWTPSYAGGASRMDFLLKTERIVVEAKMTRSGLTAKAVGDELLIDIGRYQAHPDCQTLICFVYDPDGHIANPEGLENDLSRAYGNLVVKCIVSPKGH